MTQLIRPGPRRPSRINAAGHHWIVELAPPADGSQGPLELIAALNGADIPCTAVRRAPFSHTLLRPDPGDPRPAALPPGPIFTYGSTAMAQVSQQRNWNGAYFEVPGSAQQRRIWGEEMLNARSVITTLGGMECPDAPVFVRPDAANKPFDGQVITPEQFSGWRASLLDPQRQHLPSSTAVHVSTPRRIHAEWRVMIAAGRAITASQYRLSGSFFPQPGAPAPVLEYAQAQANRWTDAPPVYVMDICQLFPGEGGLRIVELGSLSACGLYQLNLPALVQATQAALATARPRQRR